METEEGSEPPRRRGWWYQPDLSKQFIPVVKGEQEVDQGRFVDELLNTKLLRRNVYPDYGHPQELLGRFRAISPSGVRTGMDVTPFSEQELPADLRATEAELPENYPDPVVKNWASDKSTVLGDVDPVSLRGRNRTQAHAVYASVAGMIASNHPHQLFPYIDWRLSPGGRELALDMDEYMGTSQEPGHRPDRVDEDFFNGVVRSDDSYDPIGTVADALKQVYSHPKVSARVKNFIVGKTGVTPEILDRHLGVSGTAE